MAATKLFAIFIILQTAFKTAEGVRCFECQDYPSPSLCTDVTTCTKDDFCYVEEYITSSGHVVYNSGCMTKSRCANSGIVFGGKRQTDLLVCSECCQGDMCNNAGCNKQAIPRDQRGPYCFTCDFMTDPEGCDKVTVCDKDQQCSLFIPKEFHMYPTLLYSAGCQTNDSKTCSTLDQTSTHAVCPPKCCTGDFCNTACGTPKTLTSTVPTSTVTTPSTASPSNTSSSSSITAIPTNGLSSAPLTTPSIGGVSTQLPSNGSLNVSQTTIPSNSSSNVAQTTSPSNGFLSTTSTASLTTPSNGGMSTQLPSNGSSNVSQTTLASNSSSNVAQTTPPSNSFSSTPSANPTPSMTQSTPSVSVSTATTNPTTTNPTTLSPTNVPATSAPQWCDVDGYVKVPVGHGNTGPGHMCVRVGNEEVTWQEAQARCNGQGADLLVLDNGEKFHAVREYLKVHHNHVHADNIWIGAHNVNGQLEWVDGQHLTNWEGPHGGPADHHHAPKPEHGDDCVSMNKMEDYHWKNVKCDSPHTVFVCERTLPQTPSPTNGLQCDDNGYKRVHVAHANDLCIRVGQSDAKTWDEARGTCAAQNASLIRLDTNEKIHAVHDFMKTQHIGHEDKFWIGAFSPANIPLLLWQDGTPVGPLEGVDQQHLGHGHANEQHCILIDGHDHYHWGSVTCVGHHRFICQRF